MEKDKTSRNIKRNLNQFKLYRFARYLIGKLVRAKEEPEKVAGGAAIGILIGMTPTIGIQTYIALALSALSRKSKIAAILGVWVTNPFSMAFIYSLNYHIGSIIMRYPVYPDSELAFNWKLVGRLGQEIIVSLWVGGFIVGIPLAGLSYLAIYHGMQRLNRDKSKID